MTMPSELFRFSCFFSFKKTETLHAGDHEKLIFDETLRRRERRVSSLEREEREEREKNQITAEKNGACSGGARASEIGKATFCGENGYRGHDLMRG